MKMSTKEITKSNDEFKGILSFQILNKLTLYQKSISPFALNRYTKTDSILNRIFYRAVTFHYFRYTLI